VTKHKFRFGVTSYGASSAAEWKNKTQKIEELGYATLLVPDHFIEQVATIPALAMAAAYTENLRVGSIVCSNDFRHPILLAKEVATVDMLSGGRFELGIGAGWLKAEFDAVGIPFDPPGTRVSRLEEAVKVIKAYYQDIPINYAGNFYQIQEGPGLDRTPQPVQKPHPPILIGAGGKRMLSIAAREADIIGIAIKVQASGLGPDPGDIATTFTQKIEWIKAEAGDRFDDLELNIQTWAVVLTDDREQAATQLTKQFPLPGEILLNIPYLLIGTKEEIIEQIENYRERYGISYFCVFENYKDDFAPVVDALAGK
jgi:probable F420-dependent oxidoreductase